MENIRAEMFNSKAAAPENKPDQIIKGIDLKPGQNIADIGSGGGCIFLIKAATDSCKSCHLILLKPATNS